MDLLFYEYDGQADDRIPKQVHVLPQAKVHNKFSLKNGPWVTFSPRLMWRQRCGRSFINAYWGVRRRAFKSYLEQGCRYSRRLGEEYDVAISYELSWPFNYTASYVKAKKKPFVAAPEILTPAAHDYKVDRKNLEKFDKIMGSVSRQCLAKLRAKPSRNERQMHLHAEPDVAKIR